MTDRELMQQALDALEVEHSAIYGTSQTAKAIKALRARLAQPEQKHSEQWWRHEVSNAYANGYEKGRASVKQPEQEPVAWRFYDGGMWCYVDHLTDLPQNKFEPLYTAPTREWQTLTDEEMFGLWVKCPAETEDRFAFARAIEQALKEKNT